MINFEVYKENAEERLSYTSSDTPRSFIRALEDIVKLCKYGQKLEDENQTLQEQVRELERQRDCLLMRGKTPAWLLCVDCSYLVGEPCNWGCTAKLEIRKKCLEKAVERAERATGKTADVDAEEATKE